MMPMGIWDLTETQWYRYYLKESDVETILNFKFICWKSLHNTSDIIAAVDKSWLPIMLLGRMIMTTWIIMKRWQLTIVRKIRRIFYGCEQGSLKSLQHDNIMITTMAWKRVFWYFDSMRIIQQQIWCWWCWWWSDVEWS